MCLFLNRLTRIKTCIHSVHSDAQTARARFMGVMSMLKSKTTPVLEKDFYHEGRGPELQKVYWANGGSTLVGFSYYNPDDVYDNENLKHLRLEKVEAFMMAGEEVHPEILYSGKSKAAIVKVNDSKWLRQFKSPHVSDCSHFQVSFYDEIFDIICKEIVAGKGVIN